MATTSPIVSPPARFDPQGRLIPLTRLEQAQHAAAISEGLALLAEIPDEPNEDDTQFFQGFDSHRPERPLFRGLY